MDGRPDSIQILPANWVHTSTQPHDNISRTWGEFTDVKYGYHWWTGVHNTDSLFMGVGFGGQFVVVVPSRSIVIVITADKNCTLAESGQRQDALIHLMSTQVLAAVR
jgi:CubicO group peptidase (beta-lactamase class C family)